MSKQPERILVSLILATAFIVSCAKNDRYECVERSQREVPNPSFDTPGTHIEVDYVLLHDGHKIFATCDLNSVGNLDPTARCGFRPLQTYTCTVAPASLEHRQGPLSDLQCKDGDGYNVYLYVNRKE